MYNFYKSVNCYNYAVVAFFFTISLFFTSVLSAESKIPKIRHSVKALDLSRTPTTKELMAAGQLGGQLYPTEDIDIEDSSVPRKGKALKSRVLKDPKKLKRDKDINLSFGKAIDEWNRHEYKKAVKMFRKHVEEYHDSPWVDESLLHVGCDARYNGRYTEAEEMFSTIIKRNSNKKHFGAKMLLNKARQRLGALKVLQSNFDEALKIFGELKKEGPNFKLRTYASQWIQSISIYKANELAFLNCGTEALASILKRDGKKAESREILDIRPSSLSGHSINDLKSIAEKYGYAVKALKLTTADLKSIPLPAIVQIDGKNEGERGHYWVLEQVNKNTLVFIDPQSRRRFHQETEEFAREWNGNIIVFSNDDNLPGVLLTKNETEQIYGACCGIAMVSPVATLGNPDRNNMDNNKKPCPNGAPVWSVNAISLNLFVTDIPMWYTPPIGPPVNIQLSYNSEAALANNEYFGNKWQFNYGSYLVEDTGFEVTIFMPDGRLDSYMPDGDGSGNYNRSRPYQVFNELKKIDLNHFELSFPDNTVYVYRIPQGTTSLQPFLVEIKDAYGQSLTFSYNANIQLTTITDAMGKDTTLTYNPEGLVSQVTDPFGRSALFEYDGNRNLTKITDMGGFWSEFDYDADVNLTKIEDARGKYDFLIEPADSQLPVGNTGFPEPGDNMWLSYRVTITDPLGGSEEYFYSGGVGNSWYISPRDYVKWFSETENNMNSNNPKVLYDAGVPARRGGEIMQKYYNDNDHVDYAYDSNGNRTSVGDEDGNTTSSTYNDSGYITSITDPKGNVTNIMYAANEVDPVEIRNGLGTITLAYNNAHDVTSVTDLLGNSTAFQYNGYGQVIQSTDALGRVTDYSYDAENQLQQISVDGNVLDSFTYDSTGRVRTHTDASGLTLTYDYNDLNNITQITYPDSKFIAYTYSGCCPHLVDSVTDRSGKTTQYTYDALKRLVEAVDPEGKTLKYEYNANSRLTKFTDPNSNVTTFEYDFKNRLVRKNFADDKYETFNYSLAGLVADTTNARGITTTYIYDQNRNLLTVSYSDSTPGITYTYDNFNRVTRRQDGAGTYNYTYNANSQLTSVDGPWDNDTITFQYNELGQLKTMTPQGGQETSYSYDYDPENPSDIGLGRLKKIQTGVNEYTYNYSGVNPLIQSLRRPNGSFTEYVHNDPLNRLTEITNKTFNQDIISKHAFTYNNDDYIGTETVTNGEPITSFTEGLTTYDYNNLNQLLTSSNPSAIFDYDDNGNMTQGYTPDGYVFAAVYDAVDRLTSLEYTDGSSVVHRTEYYWNGGNILAQVKKFEDGSPVSDIRFIGASYLPLQERDGSNIVIKEYTWGMDMGGGIGGLLNLNQGGSDYSYLYDGKGNVMALLDSSQSVVASYRYDVFGILKAETGTLDQPYQFSTKQFDDTTGLSYYGYRFYGSTIGRWCTRDPLGEAGGINLYGFVGNNPVNFFDPYGLWTVGIGIGATGGAGGAASGSGLVVIDDNGNIGVVTGGGAGGMGGIAASGGGIIQVTNADTIYDLGGFSAQTGGSIGEGLTVGAELITGSGYMGVNINIGVGGGLTPVELHSIVEYAGVKGMNIFDLIDYIKDIVRDRQLKPDCP